jgi:hypothetical protein
MTEPNTWNYYAIIEPPTYTKDNPKGLARQRPGALRHDAEDLQFTDGTWNPSEVIALAFLGHDEEVEPITEQRARELVRTWHKHYGLNKIPEGLT